ncbi:sensor histidine kinase N-terminal domain-containing protein [Citrobacter sedlakii]|uniref:sensor histidine kinase N-terminal domain-containing protein n=1 Tax=Citrobacter sedlakii TaxID=67826 RepID=UPI001F47D409|nr:sensor histidine kinase N-terminal domain-containing protein [Citrobacter sedlakii]
MRWVKPQSLYLQLLLFLGLPLLLLWGLSAFNSYVSALQAATQAYDRTLLSSARTVAERLEVRNGRLEVNVPWVVLDSFELNMNDRLYYKVVDPAGRVISGYDDMPVMPPATSRTRLYPALAWFYHTQYRGQAIRVNLRLLHHKAEFTERGQWTYLTVGDDNLTRAGLRRGFAHHHRLFRIGRETDGNHDIA